MPIKLALIGICVSGNSPGDYKDIKDLKPGSDDIKVDEGTLSIHNIQKNHEGHYLCEAVNGIGSGLSAVITISVQGRSNAVKDYNNNDNAQVVFIVC